MNLEGKRLLILGSTAATSDLIRKARNLGIITAVTDWHTPSRSPGKLIADESYNISTSDIDALSLLIKEKKFDGVLTGYIDSTLKFYVDLCEKAKLPCYATLEQIEIMTNKDRFKELCKASGVPVVEQYDITNETSEEILNDVQFPVVIKPVDSSGSRGIKICINRADFRRLYSQALDFSASKKCIVEKFMNVKRASINLDYIIVDGEPLLSAVGDLYSYSSNDNSTPITSAVFYPSIRTEDYIKTLDDKVKSMLIKAGIRNGFMFIQSFCDDKGYYFYEPGFRLSGGQSYFLLERMNGINQLKMLINFSLTGKMCDDSTKNSISPRFNKSACGLSLLVLSGAINKIVNLDKLINIDHVVNVTQYLYEGDIIEDCDLGTSKQMLAKVHIVSQDMSSVRDTIEKILNIVEVFDKKGNSMLIKSYANKE